MPATRPKRLLFIVMILICVVISAPFATRLQAGSLTDDDQTHVEAVVSGCTLSIRVYPEKRIPPVNNWGTFLTLEIRDTNGTLLFSEGSLPTNNQGLGQMSICGSGFTPLPGNYNFRLRGYSHLWKQYLNVPAFQTQDAEVDLTGYPPLWASEISPVLDNFINGLDVSNIANSMYTNDYAADLNQDGSVNSLDISIFMSNIYRTGD
jgi:hypothetical protein